jgi:hypothetical protein
LISNRGTELSAIHRYSPSWRSSRYSE